MYIVLSLNECNLSHWPIVTMTENVYKIVYLLFFYPHFVKSDVSVIKVIKSLCVINLGLRQATAFSPKIVKSQLIISGI